MSSRASFQNAVSHFSASMSSPPLSSDSSPADSGPGRGRAVVFVVLLALGASMAGLLNDFVYDDIPLIQDNVRVHDLRAWRTLLTAPYWPAPFVEQLYRPVTMMLMAVEWWVGRANPIAFRIVSDLLYAICSALVFRLASRLVSRRAALAAAALFAVHPVHVETVALGVNQGEIVVALIAITMTNRYVDRRRTGRLAGRDWSILALSYVVATFAKENALVLPLLLVAAETLLINDTSPRDRAIAVGGIAGLVVVGCVLLLVRTMLLGHSLAVVPNEAFRDASVVERMTIMLQVVTIWVRLLLWPAHLQADYVRGDLVHPGFFGGRELLGLFIVATVVVATWVSRRRNAVFSFGLAWLILSLIPVANILPTGIILAERTLFLPSVGLAIVVAAAVDTVLRRAANRVMVRRCIWAAWGVLVTLGIVRSDLRHSIWNTAHLQVGRRPPNS